MIIFCRKGEISEDQCREGPGVIPIPNPVNTKIKVPVRLHEKIKAATEPVVGLDFVKEWIAVSDPEMEPHYECRLCGNKVGTAYLQFCNKFHIIVFNSGNRQRNVLPYYGL